jgi:hypothetical protein
MTSKKIGHARHVKQTLDQRLRMFPSSRLLKNGSQGIDGEIAV